MTLVESESARDMHCVCVLDFLHNFEAKRKSLICIIIVCNVIYWQSFVAFALVTNKMFCRLYDGKWQYFFGGALTHTHTHIIIR